MSLLQWLKQKKQKRAVPRYPMKQSYSAPTEYGRIASELEKNIDHLQQIFDGTDDLIIRRFDAFGRYPAALFYLENMVDKQEIQNGVLRPLLSASPPHDEDGKQQSPSLEGIAYESLLSGSFVLAEVWSALIEHILGGRIVILIDGRENALVAEAAKRENRALSQPETEPVIRGSREGFIENLGVNLSLLRYRLPSVDLVIKTRQIGRKTKTKVAVCYLRDVCHPSLVTEVLRRLDTIDIDGVVDSGYLEQYIEDHNISPFPQIQNTERPDKSVANLLEGRVVILVDGSPFALIAPAVFSQFYQSVDDYSERFVLSSFVRLSRLVALLFSLIFPSIYVSVISYNPELIPTEFAVAVAGGRAGVPFPALVEVLIMEISMEVLREATIRLPQQVGGALSIVGVLVIGQAAVSAGFASPITVVVIALTTIGSFATPAYNMALALRLLRFPLIILGGLFGLYGVMAGLILIVNHMLSLRSFGVPYMSPVVPGHWQGMKDTLVRAPFWTSRLRPALLHPRDPVRVGSRTEDIKRSPHNTLNPVQTGNQRWEESDGDST